LDYFHGHVHTEAGSILDGAIKVTELPVLAKEYGMSAISITDHGSLAGTLEFYRECKKASIKPVIGIEAYLTLDDDGLDNEQKTRDNYHIILYAGNEIGWKNLLYLSSNAFQNNFYYKPRISIKKLKDHANGIIASSGCLSSILSRSCEFDSNVMQYIDHDGASRRWLQVFKEIFQGRFYLELMQSSSPEQIAYNKFLIDMSKKTGVKNIITADAHYAKKEDEPLHEMLMAMQSKKTIEEYRSDGYFRYENCYIRPPAEMLAAAKLIGCEEAFHNTLEIPAQVNLEFELGKYKLPVFDITTDPDYKEFQSCIHG
jgi:DNA polymerase-3 subunit alpha